MHKISFVTGTRAEFGLLSNLIKLFNDDINFKVHLIVTGSHLSKKFGNTIDEIKDKKIKINKKIKILENSDNTRSMIKSTSISLLEIGKELEDIKADALVIVGDRYEILGAAIAASFLKIPIFHFHGGESTEGAIDEAIRHSITKMSSLHFVANKTYRKRVIQLGENPKNVFNVGGLGIDIIKQTKFLNRKVMQQKLGIIFEKRIFFVTFHPVTLENNLLEKQFDNILKAISHFDKTAVIFTAPNADSNNEVIIKLINKYVKKNKKSFFFKSLGVQKYYSLLKLATVVIGNSSSGILEVPYFKKPTVNIGNRQKGRIKASSIIDCGYDEKNIKNAISLAISEKFNKICSKSNDTYGKYGASLKSYNIIKKRINNIIIKKEFFDLNSKL